MSNDNYNGGGFTFTSTTPFTTEISTIKCSVATDSSKVSGCVSL